MMSPACSGFRKRAIRQAIALRFKDVPAEAADLILTVSPVLGFLFLW